MRPSIRPHSVSCEVPDMELLPHSLTPRINEVFHKHFPPDVSRDIQAQVDPRKYDRTITPDALIRSTLVAYLRRLASAERIGKRCVHLLGTKAHNTITEAFAQPLMLEVIRAYIARLESTATPTTEDLIALDSMANTIPKTRRHNCKKVNKKTVGGGVLWAYTIEGRKGHCPVKVLRHMQGAWHDTAEMAKGVHLEPRGPIYIMDRGFYALGLLAAWRGEHVRFVVRVKKSELTYQVLRHLRPGGTPLPKGKRLVLDAIVRLGGPRAKGHPVVRLIIAKLASGEELILATSEVAKTPEQVLEIYKKRWHVERFHRYLKDAIGLSHLYSFDEKGMEFLLLAALLLALLAFEAAEEGSGETILLMRKCLAEDRAAFDLEPQCKRNTAAPKRSKKKKKAGQTTTTTPVQTTDF